jgi:hypothetical protein
MEYQYLMAAARALGNTLISFSIVYLILRKLLNLQLKHSQKVIWFLFAWFLASIPYFFSYNPFIASRPTLVMVAPLFISIIVLMVSRWAITHEPNPLNFENDFFNLDNDIRRTLQVDDIPRTLPKNTLQVDDIPRTLPKNTLVSEKYLFSFQKNGKWGFHNRQGEIIIAPQFDELLSKRPFVVDFDNEPCAFAIGGKWGFVNSNGAIVIDPIFDGVKSFVLQTGKSQVFFQNLAGVEKGGKWGFIDTTGNIMIEPQFDAVEAFAEGLAAVKIGDRWGFIDESGYFVINPIIDVGDPAGNPDAFGKAGWMWVNYNDSWGWIDRSGKRMKFPD